jgi:uncharacterized membrane protein YhaH (DUF805 family)
MDFILLFLAFLILYGCYAFWVIRRSFQKGSAGSGSGPEGTKRQWGRYVLSGAVFLASYFLLFMFCSLVAWIMDGLLELKGKGAVLSFSLLLAGILPTVGFLPVKAAFHLIYRRPLRMFAQESYTAETKFFSWQGRIGRLRYFGGLMGVYIGMPAIWAFLVVVFMQLPLTESAKEIILMVASILMVAILIGLNVVLVVKRLHDLDRPRKYAWLLLAPLYNIYFSLTLLYQKGSFGDNRFGPDPVEPSSDILELKKSFENIEMNKYPYIIAYSYESGEAAVKDYGNLRERLAGDRASGGSGIGDRDAGARGEGDRDVGARGADDDDAGDRDKEAVCVQLREYSDNAQFKAQIVFFAENPLQFDSFLTRLGNGDYREGRKLLSAGSQKDYSGLKGYRELFGNSKAAGSTGLYKGVCL